MDVLSAMRAFRAVAAAGSFAGAARSLTITTAWVSKLVAQLEDHLGSQLLTRTSRRLSLTDAGQIYLTHCARLLDDLEHAEHAVRTLRASPGGRLKVSAPMSFGLLRLAPLFPAFCEQFPEVELEVMLDDRYVDVVEHGIDVAIRIGAALDDSSLTVRKLAAGPRVTCAAPAYLRARGEPTHPRELADHPCLRYALHAAPSRWEFDRGGQHVAVEVRGPLQVNNSIALTAAAKAGLGIFLTPDFIVAEELAAGTLVPVLSAWRPSGYTVFALSPPTRFGTVRAREFVRFVADALASGSALPAPT